MLELRARLVAGDIAREHFHRRIRRLVVEQREERDLELGIAQSARLTPGSPGYVTSPTRTPDSASGGVTRYTIISAPP